MGIYARAQARRNFTGTDDSYEALRNREITLDTVL